MKNDTWFIPFTVAVTIVVSGIILFDLSPLIRGPGQWRWGLFPLPEPRFILLSLFAFTLFVIVWYLIGIRLPDHPSRRQTWLIRGILLLAALLIQVSILVYYRLNPAEILFERLASDRAAGYFRTSQVIEDFPFFLRHYPELIQKVASSSHVQTKPPGILVIYWGASQIMRGLPWLSDPIGVWARNVLPSVQWLLSLPNYALASNATMGVLTPLISALVIWPAYGIASRRWGTLAGWMAAGLVVLIPGRLAFSPQMDTVYPFISLMAFYLADIGLRRHQPYWFLGAGFLISISSFMSPANFVLAGLIGAYAILVTVYDERDSVPFELLIKELALLAAGVCSIWLLYWLIFGVTLIDIAQAIQQHDITEGRGYWFWLLGNLIDFFILAGLPALLLAPSWPFLKKHSPLPKAIKALAVSFWLILLLFNFTGLIRAETGRIWLMMAPFPAIMAAVWVKYVTTDPDMNENILKGKMLKGGLWILIATAILAWSISLRWHVAILEWSR